MAEFGERPSSEWPSEKSAAYKKLPGNGQIALKRLRCALLETSKTANSEYVEPRARTSEGAPEQAPMIAQIVAAMESLIAAGVVQRPPVVIEAQAVNDNALSRAAGTQRRRLR
jgi:hypothetical protein